MFVDNDASGDFNILLEVSVSSIGLDVPLIHATNYSFIDIQDLLFFVQKKSLTVTQYRAIWLRSRY